jgi:hypothetical protein
MSSSFTTKPAFTSSGSDWDDSSRQHPAMKFMEEYTLMFDKRGYNSERYSDWMTEDATLTKGDGTSFSGGEACWEASKEVYAPFKEYMHCPYFLVVTPLEGMKEEEGYEMIGQAMVYGDLVGERQEGEPEKVKDPRHGRMWDVKIPGAFRFQYVKGGNNGWKLKKTDLHVDGMGAGMVLVKRGVMKL